jgi:hypothetical protein
MTSLSNYRYFSPFWASAERFQTMNRTLAGFSSVAELEGLPDLKSLFDEVRDPLWRLPKIRQSPNARAFRRWLEATAGESPDADIVKSYLEAIGEPKRGAGSVSGKFVKAVGFAAVGVALGGVLGDKAGLTIGAAAGVMAGAAASKLTEVASDTALGLLDAFVLDRVIKGRSPRMFLDDLTKLRER